MSGAMQILHLGFQPVQRTPNIYVRSAFMRGTLGLISLTQRCTEAKEELNMMRLFAICGTALATAFAASLFATAVAAQDATTDIGTLDKEAAEKAFPAKPPYSPYAGRNFPTRPYFGDTHLHNSYY